MCNQENDFVDVQENRIIELDPQILQTLLRDMSSGKNIIWAVDDYQELGDGYQSDDEITLERITGDNGGMIKPRAVKSKENKSNRTRNMAEVFTPLWICNKQNNLFDNVWFGRENVFNTEIEKNWTVCEEKIHFPNDNHHGKDGWEDYISLTCLEITCGEAPYLVSRYDTLSGEPIPLKQRIGLLDRKLRVINERTRNFKNKERSRKRWLELAKKALQSTYGFEWQGDNVLLARENLLYTVVDYYKAKFEEDVPLEWLWHFAEIIAWNIWQMDGLKCVVPKSCHDYKKNRKIFAPNMFDTKYFTAKALKRSLGYSDVDEDELQKCQGCLKDNIFLHNGVYAKIKNWSTGKIMQFKDLLDEQGSEVLMSKDFKFDVIIGNPPYQVSDGGGNGASAKSIYNYFVENAVKLQPRYITMITPSRWFAGGKGLDEFRNNMLHDNRIKIIHDFPEVADCFNNVSIKGGVSYILWDRNYKGDCSVYSHKGSKEDVLVRPLLEKGCDVFIRYNQAITILHKVIAKHEPVMKEIVSSRMPFGIPNTYKGEKTKQADDDLVIYVSGNDKEIKGSTAYISRNMILKGAEMIDWHKVYISKAGSGSDSFPHSILTKPFYGGPGTVCNESYLVIGEFTSEQECNNVIDYIKTKFFRFLVLLKKTTQNAPRGVYGLVPQQDFTQSWTDEKLYRKYNLSEDEITFINSMIKPME